MGEGCVGARWGIELVRVLHVIVVHDRMSIKTFWRQKLSAV